MNRHHIYAPKKESIIRYRKVSAKDIKGLYNHDAKILNTECTTKQPDYVQHMQMRHALPHHVTKHVIQNKCQYAEIVDVATNKSQSKKSKGKPDRKEKTHTVVNQSASSSDLNDSFVFEMNSSPKMYRNRCIMNNGFKESDDVNGESNFIEQYDSPGHLVSVCDIKVNGLVSRHNDLSNNVKNTLKPIFKNSEFYENKGRSNSNLITELDRSPKHIRFVNKSINNNIYQTIDDPCPSQSKSKMFDISNIPRSYKDSTILTDLNIINSVNKRENYHFTNSNATYNTNDVSNSSLQTTKKKPPPVLAKTDYARARARQIQAVKENFMQSQSSISANLSYGIDSADPNLIQDSLAKFNDCTRQQRLDATRQCLEYMDRYEHCHTNPKAVSSITRRCRSETTPEGCLTGMRSESAQNCVPDHFSIQPDQETELAVQREFDRVRRNLQSSGTDNVGELSRRSRSMRRITKSLVELNDLRKGQSCKTTSMICVNDEANGHTSGHEQAKISNQMKDTKNCSEHELRFKRSLHNLDVPDWYSKSRTESKPNNCTQPRNKSFDRSSSQRSDKDSRHHLPSNCSNYRLSGGQRGFRSRLISDSSNVSSESSYSVFNDRLSVGTAHTQPYTGWRTSDRSETPHGEGIAMTPNERLTLSLQQAHQSCSDSRSSELEDSICRLSSTIVGYFGSNGRNSSANYYHSANQPTLWIETSFVNQESKMLRPNFTISDIVV